MTPTFCLKLRAQPDSKVLSWMASQPADAFFVSAVTQAEVMLGARLLPNGLRRKALEQALEAMFLEAFVGRTLLFDSSCTASYAELVAPRRASGRPISQFDAQIAAIAVSHRLGLATRNVSDFDNCGLTVTNPWDIG